MIRDGFCQEQILKIMKYCKNKNTAKIEQRIGISLYFQSIYTNPSLKINQKLRKKANHTFMPYFR